MPVCLFSDRTNRVRFSFDYNVHLLEWVHYNHCMNNLAEVSSNCAGLLAP